MVPTCAAISRAVADGLLPWNPNGYVCQERQQTRIGDDDGATADTIRKMCDQINEAAQDPVVQNAARDAVRRFRGGPLYIKAGINSWMNPGAIAESCWWAAKFALRFEHHEDRIRIWFNERNQLQLLISPSLLVRFPSKGDCAIYSLLICAFLKALNLPFEIVTLAVNPFEPEVFGHVFPRAVMPDGRRIPLDASHGPYPGWQVPREHTLRSQVWDEQGNPIPDRAGKFRGLHAVAPTPAIGIQAPPLTLTQQPQFWWALAALPPLVWLTASDPTLKTVGMVGTILEGAFLFAIAGIH